MFEHEVPLSYFRGIFTIELDILYFVFRILMSVRMTHSCMYLNLSNIDLN